MNYPTGYETVNRGDIIKKNWLYYDDGTWKLTECVGITVPRDMIEDYCRPIKHHDPKHSNLSPLPAHRFITIGEEIKVGDYSYKGGVGPWGPVLSFVIGDKYDGTYVPMCRPIEQPNKETPMLVLELKIVDRSELPHFAKSSDVVLFKIIQQEGFARGKEYKASNGINIKSLDSPEYYSRRAGTFYLRGNDKDKDNTVIAVTQEEFSKIQAAVNEILERENKPKFLETITFKSAQTGKRHKVNVISNDGQDLRCVDCDTNKNSIFSVSLLTDIQTLPNAF